MTLSSSASGPSAVCARWPTVVVMTQLVAMYCVAAHASHRGGNDLRRFSKKGASTDGGVLTAPAEPRAGLAKQQRLHVYCFHSDAGYICQCVCFRTPALGGPNGFRSGGWVNRHSRPDTTEPLPYKRSRVCLPRLYCRRSVGRCGFCVTRSCGTSRQHNTGTIIVVLGSLVQFN